MKLKNSLFLTVPLAFTLTFSSCSDDDDSSSSSSSSGYTVSSIQNTVQSGTWRITLFNDSGNDETYHFSGYTFEFNANGALIATNDSITNAGTWSVTDDSGDDDDGSSDLDFNIMFPTPQEFVDLTDDWDIVDKSETMISLRDVSGGNGDVDQLIFEKN